MPSCFLVVPTSDNFWTNECVKNLAKFASAMDCDAVMLADGRMLIVSYGAFIQLFLHEWIKRGTDKEFDIEDISLEERLSFFFPSGLIANAQSLWISNYSQMDSLRHRKDFWPVKRLLSKEKVSEQRSILRSKQKQEDFFENLQGVIARFPRANRKVPFGYIDDPYQWEILPGHGENITKKSKGFLNKPVCNAQQKPTFMGEKAKQEDRSKGILIHQDWQEKEETIKEDGLVRHNYRKEVDRQMRFSVTGDIRKVVLRNTLFKKNKFGLPSNLGEVKPRSAIRDEHKIKMIAASFSAANNQYLVRLLSNHMPRHFCKRV